VAPRRLDGPPAIRSMFAEMLRTLLGIRLYVAALLVALTAKAAIMPGLSWIAKEGIEAVQAPGATISGVIAAVGIPFLVLVLAGAVADFAEKFASKATEQRLIIVLQRIYLARRNGERAARDVTQILYGSEVAKKGFEVIYKDSWRLASMIGSIVIWQLTISPAWVPLLLASILPALAFVWLVGPYIQRVSRVVLALQRMLAARTRAPRRVDFERSQERLFRSTLWLEIMKFVADRGMAAVLWVGVGLCVGASILLDLGLVPDDRDVAVASSFAVNLALLAGPLGEIGKVYTKWREAVPALLAAYGRG